VLFDPAVTGETEADLAMTELFADSADFLLAYSEIAP